ncbi:hypothetical protein HPP92_026884 [Vanilla planifolia]|uniref:Uncharacterized protein n=1 Tax=Vanilla planifolia TaxID=51239 RepID=A0A835PBC1_VANPL|nr:hypothetical protein HPP92_026884 [Vanilla planifolia]
MDAREEEDSNDPRSRRDHILQKSRLSFTKCFDALWFCYSPVHQMQQYYRYGQFDNCGGKWSALVDCLVLKTKRSNEVEEILQGREKSKPHIWTYRTVEEAAENWWHMYHRFSDAHEADQKPKM